MLLSNRLSAIKVSVLATVVIWGFLFLYHQKGRAGGFREVDLGVTRWRKPTKTTIPEKIWYKLGPRGLSNQSREWIDSCVKPNPTYKYEFMTDLSAEVYVKKNFASRQDIVETYLALPFPILKADMLRYLLLFNEGGIWSDLDVSCEAVPIRDWVPERFRRNATLVVGWEFDVGWGDSFTREFATWTIMAKPGSEHMMRVIDDVLEGVREKTTRYNVTVSNLTWEQVGDIVDLTGPRRMTSSIFKSLESKLGDEFDAKVLDLLYEPKMIGDILVMPGYSFANGSNTYKPEDTQTPVLVTHHFAGSWKNENGGEMVDLA